MPNHSETKILCYTPEQLFNLVASVEHYPLFLPWILNAHVYNVTDTAFDADLTVGVESFKQNYTSHVTLDRDNLQIEAINTKGPFSHLHNKWAFTPLNDAQGLRTQVNFMLDFEIDNLFLRPIMQPFMTQATKIMIEAFEKRAQTLYTV